MSYTATEGSTIWEELWNNTGNATPPWGTEVNTTPPWDSNFNTTTADLNTSISINTTLAPPRPRPPSLTDILMQYSAYRMSLDVGYYGCAVLIALGTVTNILTIVVMTRRTLISTSTCFYFALLASVDLVVLYMGCLRRLLWVKV
jgi:hypothetical protein